MMSAKFATPDLLEIKILRNNGYGVIVLDYDVSSRTLSCDSKYIVDLVM